jgi:hypothetical protein
MYAAVYSVDVRGGTIICALYSVNSTLTYTQKYTNVHYFLEYPLTNTWMYETTFRLLCNSTRRRLGLGRHSLLIKELVVVLPYKYPLPP